ASRARQYATVPTASAPSFFLSAALTLRGGSGGQTNVRARAKQPVVLFLHDAVTLAGDRREPVTIRDAREPASHGDQTLRFERRGNIRHARAAHAEHLGGEFLRQPKILGLDAVAHLEQPARIALLDVVHAIASGTLRDLRDQRLRVPEQHIA